jgi:nucleoside-diphosphate-sugar epimerase
VRRALVSGSAGFVGRHFTRHLLARGWEVYGFDTVPHTAASTPGRPGWSVAWQADARDFFRVENASYDLVIHAAAVVGGRDKIENDPLAITQNYGIDAEMFRWALRTRPAKVVYFSSSAVYPTYLQAADSAQLLQEPMVDAAAQHLVGVPDQTYGWAKLTGERSAVLARAEGLDVLVVRPFSGYGEDQSLDYPWPSFAARARRHADPFEIWGDGEQVRDWFHIDDVVGATMAAVELGVPGPVNLGSGVATSFNDLAAMFCGAAGYEPELKHLPAAPTGVQWRVCDPTRLFSFYTPTVSLEEGIRRALG